MRLPRLFPEHLTREQKRRLLWLIPLMVALCSIEAFYLIKLMRSANPSETNQSAPFIAAPSR
jgi:hypothetical protein